MKPTTDAGATYLSPDLPGAYMLDLVQSLRAREGYTVQVNKPHAAYSQ